MLTHVASNCTRRLSVILTALVVLTATEASKLPSEAPAKAFLAKGISLLEEGTSEAQLLAEDAALTTGSDGELRPPKDPHWFQTFSEAESTYDQDAEETSPRNPMHHYLDGWEPTLGNPYNPYGEVVRPEKFHESPSAGWKQAWQTFYPAVQKGIAGHGVQLGKWTENAGGSYTQDYRSREGDHFLQQGRLPADWFDTSVNQIDGFGRQKEPNPLAPNRYITWEERTVNTTLTCQLPGCAATSNLQAFDGITEQARNCKLNFQITPTDFDDQYSDELLEYVTVNDVTVDVACKPRRSGCNQTAQRALFPCAKQVNLDKIINAVGTLRVSAKINKVVDECPYMGNMLHAVPQVTCLVAGKQPSPIFANSPQGASNDPAFRTHHSAAPPRSGVNVDLSAVNHAGGITTITQIGVTQSGGAVANLWSAKGPLVCVHRGCTASSVVELPVAFQNSSCALSIEVNQTDFDREDASNEAINFIAINDKNITTRVWPMNNPCKAAYRGAPLPASDLVYTAVKDYPVPTSDLAAGLVMMSAQITEFVDECVSNGYLLDASFNLTCTDVVTPAR